MRSPQAVLQRATRIESITVWLGSGEVSRLFLVVSNRASGVRACHAVAGLLHNIGFAGIVTE
jgi:hypothetical protein